MDQKAGAKELIDKLRREVLGLQGFRTQAIEQYNDISIGLMEKAFPGAVFPTGVVHELVSNGAEAAAATSGFITGLLGQLVKKGGLCLWIGNRRAVFPPALQFFGVAPDRVVFIDLVREKDVLWAIEEALKCEALSVVVGECKELSLTESRRLQLAVEQSHVTALLHRYNPRNNNPIASVARWQVRPLASELEEGMPGVGYPRWNVALLKVRSGIPGQWQIEWNGGQFRYLSEAATVQATGRLLKTG